MNAPWPGPLGPPPDVPAVVAAVGALLMLIHGRRVYRSLVRSPRWALLAVLSLSALGLSAIYVRVYLRGGPRIIDATSYWLAARAMAEGHLSWAIDEPTAAARGRFLLLGGSATAPRLSVIFPPGYPVVLALGFALGAPMWVGPVIAALLVLVTYALAREVSQRDDVARIAAALSVVSAALRYHTADTMSHGWAALLAAATLLLAHRAQRVAPGSGGSSSRSTPTDRPARATSAALAGVALGWLFATRPLSAAALAPLVVWWIARAPRRCAAALALGALGPCALLAWQQHAVTGELLRSSQAAYYALADGPPGCFRYGFGRGIGCLHEHGAYVASLLPNGLDARAAAITTLRRLRLHLIDVANAEPLALLAWAAPFLARRAAPRTRASAVDGVAATDADHPVATPDAGHPVAALHADHPHVGDATSRSSAQPSSVVALALAPALLVAAYAAFYFDGSYPGGGARFFADVLPIEHVLIACALPPLAAALQTWVPTWDLARTAAFALALAIGGFAVHAAYEHIALRDREGGRPFFEPAVAVRAGVTRGLLLVNTDHGFNLAYDPDARDAASQLVVAKERGDDRDRLVWDRLGRPPAYRYDFDAQTGPTLARWWPPHPYDVPTLYRYEAEAEWPPLSQSGGYFEPMPASGTCAWGGALLSVHTTPDAPFHGSIAVPVPYAGRFSVAVHVASRGDAFARFALQRAAGASPLATWAYARRTAELTCATLREHEATLDGSAVLEVSVPGGTEMWVDAVALSPTERAGATPPIGPP